MQAHMPDFDGITTAEPADTRMTHSAFSPMVGTILIHRGAAGAPANTEPDFLHKKTAGHAGLSQ